ncbi:RNA pseudouridine synthase [Bacillus sp. FJAT-27225]|uniref:RluA family pseudouridine synthase n=1 Tax=Bacillus sp. FJAT-27225 TaxID=1743144 RepID=UPI00080C3589|nr:RluA family pseudouridine synthase [Bacillus sp. FJAT-27225]OCA84423.1 RNA pseudouridine synthase [Bacillus sp. FJAT-27225]
MLTTKMLGNKLELTIPFAWQGITVQQIFREKWKTSKKQAHLFRMEGRVTFKGEKIGWDKPLDAGSKLLMDLFDTQPTEVEPFYLDLAILYEDEHVLVVNKPAFLNTHPNTPGETETLLNAVSFHLQSEGKGASVQQTHRLDRDTTGAILFAKHPLAGAILDGMLEKRLIKRTYIAAVCGTGLKKKDTINLPIGRDRHHSVRRRVSPSGQAAITHYKVLKTEPYNKLTFVACRLDTGRTHQIRVHFSHIGYPLAGDELYGGRPLFTRQALHAAKLEFTHPITLERLAVRAPFMDSPPIFKDIDLEKI